MRVVENDRRIIAPLRRSRELRLIQTHISWVLLDGAHAFKIKKPVRFSFVDYTSAAKRRAYCRRELAVNSRLSPGLYIGVVPVRDDDGAVTLRRAGPDDRLRRRDARDAAGLAPRPPGREGPRRAGRDLADRPDALRLSRRARIAAPRYGSPRAIRAGFEHAFRLKALIEREFGAGAALDQIEEKVDGFLLSHAGLFRERVRQGRIRHCHGDLRMSNIFIEGGTVHIFDAVEFNPGLASSDVAADVAYLAMDLRYCGKDRLAERLIDAYAECSGDEGLRALADFYQCYRALVRLLVEVPVHRRPRDRRPAKEEGPAGLPADISPWPTRSPAACDSLGQPSETDSRKETEAVGKPVGRTTSTWIFRASTLIGPKRRLGRAARREVGEGRFVPLERDAAVSEGGPAELVAFERV